MPAFKNQFKIYKERYEKKKVRKERITRKYLKYDNASKI